MSSNNVVDVVPASNDPDTYPANEVPEKPDQNSMYRELGRKFDFSQKRGFGR